MQYLKWYPSYEDNREKPEGERIFFMLCPLNFGEISKANKRTIKTPIESSILYIVSTKTDGTVVKTPLPDNVEYEDNEDEILLETISKHVGEIGNLTDVYGSPVKDGKALSVIRTDWPLIKEAEGALISHSRLKAGLEKNLLPPLDGVQGKRQGGGIATDAKKKG